MTKPRSERHAAIWQVTLWGLSLATAVVLPAVIFLVNRQISPNTSAPPTDISNAVIASLVVSLLILVVERTFAIEAAFKKNIDVLNNIAAKAEVRAKHTKMIHQGPIYLRPVMQLLQSRMDRAVNVNDELSELVISDAPKLVWESYKAFWESLISDQESRPERTLSINVVHSTEIKPWLEQEALFAAQKRFCKAGGKITRVLVGREAMPNQETSTVMQKMHAAGVKVGYFPIGKHGVDHDFTWDFLYFDVPSTALVWHGSGFEGMVTKAVYQSNLNYNGRSLETIWKKIEEYMSEGNEWFTSDST